MENQNLNESLKKLNDSHKKIFEDYVKSGYLESIAKTMCYLPEEKALALLKEFPDQQKEKISKLMKEFSKDEEAQYLQILQLLQVYDTDIESKLEETGKLLKNYSPSSIQQAIDSQLSDNPVLAEKIQSMKFTMETYLKMNDQDIQILMRETDNWKLCSILWDCSEKIRNKFLSNVSEHVKQMVTEDLAYKRNLTCEEKRQNLYLQQELFALTEKLYTENLISLDFD